MASLLLYLNVERAHASIKFYKNWDVSVMNLIKGYIDSEYGQLHYRYAPARTKADKLPLMCLHQSPKSSLEFERFMIAAARDRDVYCVDYPGYGMSSHPPTEDECTIEAYARAAFELADAKGLIHFDVLGYHTGCMVGCEMANAQPQRIRAIGMISIILFSADEVTRFEKLFTPIELDSAGTRLNRIWNLIVQRRGPGVTLEMLDRSFYQSLMGGEAYEAGHFAVFRYVEKLRGLLKTLPHPKVVLNVSDDLWDCTQRAQDDVKNIQMIERPDWGYGLLDVNSEEICDLMLERIDAC